jgi:hypothetical protein
MLSSIIILCLFIITIKILSILREVFKNKISMGLQVIMYIFRTNQMLSQITEIILKIIISKKKNRLENHIKELKR